MEPLGKYIERCLEERGFCLVFEDELERCWPSQNTERTEREKQIQAFAKFRGWSASVLDTDSGDTRAIFRHGS
jgi:hypothetical protein